MTEKFKILSKYIKDLSSETPNIETYLFVKERIAKYQLGIDINSKALKNKMVEVNTSFKFEDRENNEKKSYFEIIYSTIIKINEEVQDKKELEKIILVKIPAEVYPTLYETFIYLFKQAGIKDINIEKNLNFEAMYNEKKKG